MPTYVFQFEDDIDSKRPCRLLIDCSICAVTDVHCKGRLFDRPVWCPLNVIHEKEKPS
jgi:hypothetical protein